MLLNPYYLCHYVQLPYCPQKIASEWQQKLCAIIQDLTANCHAAGQKRSNVARAHSKERCIR